MNWKIYKPFIVLITFIILLPVITSLTGSNFYLTQVTMAAYYLLVALGLCLLMGYTGQVSLGQAGFFAIGGYTSAYLTTINLAAYSSLPVVRLLSSAGILTSGKNLYDEKILYLCPWAAFAAAILLSVAIAWFIGIPVLKLKGHYLVMATMSFGVVIEVVVRATKAFGGADGLSNVPAFTLVPGISVSGEIQDRVMNYFIAWTIVILGMLVLVNLINSRVGRALRSLRDNEDATGAMGVDTSRFKLLVFIISAVFAAVAGVFLTHFNASISPGEASVMKSVRYVSIVAIGGMSNIWGTLVMGLILFFMSLRGIFGSYDDAVFGAILIFVMLFAPDGLLKKQGEMILGRLLNRLPSKGK
ncbi:MAG: branched-chain amino acid ABC transporter permease [Clostridiales bacterium]|nr:branched-chain amino acid ABC transporter permease [Clostridiales bacterium]